MQTIPSKPAVEAYDPRWAVQFEEIRAALGVPLGPYILGFEHVGSTSVPGLAAKPVIDIDLIFSGDENLREIILVLESFGYRYEGNKGIEGRESFKAPAGAARQNLYACRQGCLALRNHLLVRDHLRANPRSAQEYGELKFRIAPLYSQNPERYVEGKTAFLVDILRRSGVPESELREVEAANVAKVR